jgi:hypothetical protein
VLSLSLSCLLGLLLGLLRNRLLSLWLGLRSDLALVTHSRLRISGRTLQIRLLRVRADPIRRARATLSLSWSLVDATHASLLRLLELGLSLSLRSQLRRLRRLKTRQLLRLLLRGPHLAALLILQLVYLAHLRRRRAIRICVLPLLWLLTLTLTLRRLDLGARLHLGARLLWMLLLRG